MDKCLNPILAYDTGRLTKNGKVAYYLDLRNLSDHRRLRVEHWMKFDYDPLNTSICYHDDLTHFDYLTKYVEVPCGKCLACACNKAVDLSTRLYLEATKHKFYYFVTLTYAPEHYSHQRDFKRDFQLFMKRLRKKVGSDNPIRYFATFEHGEKFGRGHYHCILYFDKPFEDNLIFKSFSGKYPLFVSSLISSLWTYGFNTVGTSNDSIAALNYVSKYCVKKVGFDLDGFYLFSRKPGLGNDAIDDIEDNFIIVNDGKSVFKRRLPRYVYETLETKNKALYEVIRDLKRQFITHAYDFPKPKTDSILNQQSVIVENIRQFIIDKFGKIS